ncbi:unnamed protein product, partial [Discosporangium mesarthrocarpum]
KEREAADSGSLDVVCGFMVIDDDCRTVVLEGLGAEGRGLSRVMERAGRAGPNSQGYRVLANPHVRFSQRLYTSFDSDLKKVGTED